MLIGKVNLPDTPKLCKIPMIEVIADQPVYTDASTDPRLAASMVWAMYCEDIRSCPSLALATKPEIDFWEGL